MRSSGRAQSRFLFADPDSGFLEEISKDPKAKAFPPTVASLGHEAVSALREPRSNFVAIFINHRMVNPDAKSIVKAAKQSHPAVAVFLIFDKRRPRMSEQDLKDLGVSAVMPKKFTYSEILKRFLPPHELFDPEEIISLAAENSDPFGQPTQESESNFFTVPAGSFLTGKKSLFDVYIRLTSGRLVKILRAGDELAADRLQNFMDKGVDRFFIRNEAHEAYLTYTDKLVSSMSKHPKINQKAKFSTFAQHADQVLQFMQTSLPLEDRHMQFATSYVSSLWELMNQMNLFRNSKIARHFIDDTMSCDHSVATTVLASLVAHEMGFETQKSLKIVGVAGMFHDIGLASASEILKEEDEQQMSPSQRKNYHEHPGRGAQIMKEIRGVDNVVPQAIAYHHRRRNGTGFPNVTGIGLSSVSIPGEIIGICDEFIRCTKKHQHSPKNIFEIKLETMVFNHFPKELVDILKKILNISDD